MEQIEKVEKAIRTPSELPNGWKKAPLVEIADIIMGQSPSSEYYNADRDGLPFFQGKAEFGDLYPEPVKWCSQPSKVAQKDDILISVRAPVGPTNLAPSECCIGRGLAAIRPRDGIPSKYLLYYLRNIEGSLDALGTGTTFKAISGKVLHAIPVPVAPPDQQKRIVAEIEKQFSRLDEAVANLKRVKTNLKRYKAAVLKAAVEGKLTEEWRKGHPDVEPAIELLKRILAERRSKWNGKGKYSEPSAPDAACLPGLPNGWTWTSLEQLSWQSSYGTSVKCSYESAGPPVLRIPNIASGRVDLSDLKYARGGESLADEDQLATGDLLIIRTNGSKNLIGRSAIVREEFSRPTSYASYLIRFRLVPETALIGWLATIWDCSFLRAWIEQRAATSAGQHNISMSILSRLPVPLPPLAEEERIVAEVERRLSVVGELEATLSANLQRAIGLRQSVLAQAFSGRLFLTQQTTSEV